MNPNSSPNVTPLPSPAEPRSVTPETSASPPENPPIPTGVSHFFQPFPISSVAPLSPATVDPNAETNEPQLSPPQLAAVDLLLQGRRDVDVADQLGVCRRTIYNWRTRNPLFAATLQSRRDQLFSATADRLRALMTSSLDTLERHAKDPHTATAHRAAKTLLYASGLPKHLAK